MRKVQTDSAWALSSLRRLALSARRAHDLPPDERELAEALILAQLRGLDPCSCRTDVAEGQYSTDCLVHGLRAYGDQLRREFGDGASDL